MSAQNQLLEKQSKDPFEGLNVIADQKTDPFDGLASIIPVPNEGVQGDKKRNPETPNINRILNLAGSVVDGVSGYGETAKNAALGVIPDTLTSAYNIPAQAYNAANEASQSDLGKQNEAEATELLKKNPMDAQGLLYERYKPRGDASQRAPLIPSVRNLLEEKRNNSIDPKDKWKHEALAFATSIAAPGALASKFGEKGLKLIERGLNLIGSTKKSDLAVAGTIGGASQLAKDNGFSDVGAIGLGLGVGSGALASGKLASVILQGANKRNLLTAVGHSPKNIDLKAVEAAEAAGLNYPTTYANKSAPLSLVEQATLRTPFVGTKHARKLENIDKEFSGKVSEIINASGKRLVGEGSDDLFAAGERLTDILKKSKAAAEVEKDALYKSASDLLNDQSVIVPVHTKKALNEVKNSIKTFSPATDESLVIQELEKLKKNIGIENVHGDFLPPAHIDYLTGTKRSYNDKINWDVMANGPKEMLKKIRVGVKKDLESYGEKNPEWYKAFKKADEFYGKYLGDEAFASDYIKKLFKEENPEKLLPRLNEVSKFKNIENSLGSSEQAVKFMEDLKREKLEELFVGKVVNEETKQVSYRSFAKALENPDQAHFIKYLVGDSSYNKLKTLSQYAQAMVRRQERNPNKSGSASSGVVLGAIAGVVAGGSLIGAARNAAKGALVGWTVSQVVTNKKLLNMSVNAAKASASGNAKEAIRWGTMLDDQVLQSIGDKKFMAISSTMRLLNDRSEQ